MSANPESLLVDANQSMVRLAAEDNATKPFSPIVLAAHVEEVLRRLAGGAEAPKPVVSESPITIHELTIHPGQHRVHCDGEPIELNRTEFRVLQILAGKPGWVFSRKQILEGLYGEKHGVANRAVDVQVVGLRKKLGTAGKYIETVRCVGYRFKE